MDAIPEKFLPEFKRDVVTVARRGELTRYLTNELIDAHDADPEFGYRFLTDELERAGCAGCAFDARRRGANPSGLFEGSSNTTTLAAIRSTLNKTK